ncbi:MAG: hypothetical protein JWN96_1585, partial [Mycobacterium sp.]|nr:hypothetical protein [Mycobacterium sp.]
VDVSVEALVLAAALGVADAVGLLVAVEDEEVEDEELAAALGVAVADGVLAVLSVEFVVTFETVLALSVSFCASRPTVVAPTAATAVSPTVATATRRRPRSLAFTLPPTSRPAARLCLRAPTFESLPVRGLWLNRELLQGRGHR